MVYFDPCLIKQWQLLQIPGFVSSSSISTSSITNCPVSVAASAAAVRSAWKSGKSRDYIQSSSSREYKRFRFSVLAGIQVFCGHHQPDQKPRRRRRLICPTERQTERGDVFPSNRMAWRRPASHSSIHHPHAATHTGCRENRISSSSSRTAVAVSQSVSEVVGIVTRVWRLDWLWKIGIVKITTS